MKFRKPQDGARWFVNVDFIGKSAKELQRFVDSLPDEFEILGPGEAAVKWPEGLTRSHLEASAERADRACLYETGTWLRALAAIAPERKKRRVNLWRFLPEGELELKPTDWAPFAHHEWRKVAGPIELDD